MPLHPQSNLIAKPTVYLIGYQSVGPDVWRFLENEGHGSWTTSTTFAPEAIVEVAGRVCYMSFAGGREHGDYIKNIKEQKHGSVLEHAHVTVILTGISRSLTHELVRHRAGWSYSQLSQRYVDESECQFVCPAEILACKDDPTWHHIYDEWVRLVTSARFGYRHLAFELGLKRGDLHGTDAKKAVRGAARSVLPNAVETKITCTVNARALRHFLEMRASRAADAEIRHVALLIYRACLPVMPDILGDYVVHVDETDGSEYLTTPYMKV